MQSHQSQPEQKDGLTAGEKEIIRLTLNLVKLTFMLVLLGFGSLIAFFIAWIFTPSSFIAFFVSNPVKAITSYPVIIGFIILFSWLSNIPLVITLPIISWPNPTGRQLLFQISVFILVLAFFPTIAILLSVTQNIIIALISLIITIALVILVIKRRGKLPSQASPTDAVGGKGL